MDRGSTARAGDYILFYGKRKENHKLGTGYFDNHITEVTVKRAELVIVRISYIAQRGRWCNYNDLNAHAPISKVMTQRTVFMRNFSRFSNIFLNSICKFCQESLMQNWGERIF